jgi:hypothetical protein
MFVLPAGMMFGAPISLSQALLWNLLPVTLGNIFAGTFLTGMALYATYSTAAAQTPATAPHPSLQSAQTEPAAAFVASAGSLQ